MKLKDALLPQGPFLYHRTDTEWGYKIVIIYVMNDVVIGMISLGDYKDDNDTRKCYLYDLSINEKYRKRGLGVRMVKAAINLCKLCGKYDIRIGYTTEWQKEWYKRLGFINECDDNILQGVF